MYRQAITYLVLSAALTRLVYAQSVIPVKEPPVKKNPASERVKSLDELSKDEYKPAADYINARDISNWHSLMPPPPGKTEEKGLQSLVSSFRSNIRFGGFWDKYAIINFSPSVFITPFDFISIYGNHNAGFFIPINAIKHEMKSLCIRSAAILAIDNACRFLMGTGGLVPAVTNFVLKAAVLGLLKTTPSTEVIQYNTFYYAVSVRF
jgi:hypothetical protein